MPKAEILYISYDGMTDPLGQSQVLPYLFGLSKVGYAITLISCEKKERFASRENAIRALCKANRIDWRPIIYTKRPPVLSTLYDIYKIKRVVNKILKEKRIQLVHCRSYIAALIGLELKRTKGIKFLFDMRGFWADERIDGALWSLKNPLYRLVYRYFKKQEIAFLQHADYVISLTHCAAQEIRSWHHLTHQPHIEVIPCSADLELFNPNRITEAKQIVLRAQLSLNQDDFILSYIGSIGTWYLLDEMLEFFVQLKIKKPSARFLFITNDSASSIRSKAEQLQIPEQDIIITNASRDNMPLYISLSSYTLFFIKPSYSKKASSPVKQGEAMSMGIPIVCNKGVGDSDLIVNECRAGFVVDELRIADYNRCIDLMLSSPVDSNNIKRGAKKWYALDHAIEQYSDVYNKILTE